MRGQCLQYSFYTLQERLHGVNGAALWISSFETRSGSKFDASNAQNHAYICNYKRFLCYLYKSRCWWSVPATPAMPRSTMSTCVFGASLRGSSCCPSEKRGNLRGTKYILSVVGCRGAAQGASLYPDSAEANFCRDGGSQSPRTCSTVLKCDLGMAPRRYWSGSSGTAIS